MPPKRRRIASPKRVGRATPHIQRGVVKLARNSKYRILEPLYPQPKWARDSKGRLVSNLPTRPNVGGYGTLEVYYHVKRKSPDEVLPPPQALWRQRYGDQQTVSYRPLWVDIAGNLTSPLRLRRRSDGSIDSSINSSVDSKPEGRVGLPYLYTYDESLWPDEDGLQYRRWRPLQVLANGGYGVVISYVDDARGFTEDAKIEDEDIVVAKFNYLDGELEEIMRTLVNDISMSSMIRNANPGDSDASATGTESDEEESAVGAEPPAPVNEGRVRGRDTTRVPVSLIRKRRRDVSELFSRKYNHYNHFKSLSTVLDVDTTDTFRQETQVLEILDMTGSPHFPKFWKLPDPPQDGTLCTMEYIPGGLTLDEHLDTLSNNKIPIRLVWEAVFCLSKAMSVMAYGNEDPAPSHRVHGWNQIVHLDWSQANIFVRKNTPSHTCSHSPCFVVGDFGFAVIVPNRPRARREFRLGHLRLAWHRNLNPGLPEADIDTTKPFRERVNTPIIGHFSHKTNIYCMAEVWREILGGVEVGKTGIMRYMQDNLTPVEQARLARDLQSHLPEDEQLGQLLDNGNDDDDDDEDDDDVEEVDDDDDDDDDDAEDRATRVRGYVDVAESLLAQQVPISLRVSEQRFVNIMTRCLNHDPADRPEIEEIMLHAARGMAEAGVYVPSTPSSSDSGDN